MQESVTVRMCDFQKVFGYSRQWAYSQSRLGNFAIYIMGPRSSHVERAEVEAFLFGRPQQEGTE